MNIIIKVTKKRKQFYNEFEKIVAQYQGG